MSSILHAGIRDRIFRLKATASQNKTSFKKRIGQASFKFAPFSPKQKKILTWWCDASPVKDMDGIIADGAIRSGKTISMSLSFGLWAMEVFRYQNFLICGKTIGSLRRNVIFWWKIMMRSQGFRIKETRTDNLLTVTRGETVNYFYLFGGKDERSQDLVQGITAAGVLFDEVALMPESFVNQATGRCSVDGSKFWFNCNPEGPGHWFKINWIDRLLCHNKDKEPESGVVYKNLLYLHFTMDDNLSLSEAIKERYRSMYSGLFFKRLVQGLWCVAEGVIFDMFDDEGNTFDDVSQPKGLKKSARRFIAVDYGTVNPMVYLDCYDDDDVLWIINEYYYRSKDKNQQKTDAQYADEFESFINANTDGLPVYTIIDPSAASFKAELRNRGYRIKDADNDVNDGIRVTSTMIYKRKLKVHKKNCPNWLREIKSYAWDGKAALRGVEQPIKQEDHAMDATRYLCKTMISPRRLSA